ncbi:MAG TPA: hypothetical protein VFS52_20530 [Steroidobacteraceae bacterium]|nr:hypothetical protein [Steroidobacteraceae bacterium]
MVSQRTVLQSAVAATSLSVLASAGWTRASGRTATSAALDHPALYKVLIDNRFAAARAFGREAIARGETVHAFDGDVTDIWYHDLYHRWREGRAAIAGFTTYGTCSACKSSRAMRACA